jgi:hypothetical protein
MRYFKILGLGLMLLSFLPTVLAARPQYPATTSVAWTAPDRDDWGYRDRDDYYRYRDRDDRRYWRRREREARRWRRLHRRDSDDWLARG